MSDPAELQILIDIKARLDVLNATQEGLKHITEEASGIGKMFKEGLGIGSGMELARRAVDLFRDVLRESIGEAQRMAGEIRDGSEALQISTEAYQVFQIELGKANVGMDRLSMAISTQTQHLAQVRSGASGAAEAYRTLGLNAAEMEGLSPDQRVLKVAEAMTKAADQTKAFAAAGQILGSRQLPQLISGLRDLASNYNGAAAAAKASGLIMSDDTAKRLDQAQKNIEKFKRFLAVQAGEMLGEADMVKKAAEKNATQTVASFALMLASLVTNPALFSQTAKLFKATVAGNQPPAEPEAAAPKLDPAEVARQENLREQLKQAQLQLATVQANAGVLEKDSTLSDSDRAARKMKLLREQVEALTQVFDLTKQVQAFDTLTGPQEKGAVLLKQTSDLSVAKIAVAEADGKGANFMSEQLETGFALLELRKEMIRLGNENDPLGNEVKLREHLLPLLRAQAEILAKIGKSQFPDADALFDKQAGGTIKPDELQRLNAYVALLARKAALIKEEPTLTANNSFTVLPKSAAQKTSEEFGRFQKGRNETGEQRLGAGEGLEAGAQQYVMSLGTQGEQVASALQSSLGATVSSISEGIYGWATGASTFGDAMRGLLDSVFKTLLDTVVQMGAQWVINAALAKGSMISTFLIAVGLRKAEAADVIATEATKTPVLAANAGFSAVGSFGLAAVVGIALLAALMGAFLAGFADGGYTGSGGKYEPAGIVHRGESVWSQADIARAGGIGNVEALRMGGGVAALDSAMPPPRKAQPSSTPSLSLERSMAALTAQVSAKTQPRPIIAFAENYTDIHKIKMQIGFEKAIVETVQRRLGDILG